MNKSSLDQILFVDIETVSGHADISALEERLRKQWERKSEFFQKSDDKNSDELYSERAAMYAEFGKIIVIGMGFYAEDGKVLRLKALYNTDEHRLLSEFTKILKKFDPEYLQLCAHNGKSFDFPYLSRRILINGLKLPEVLRLSGKKPWEINHLDTMEMWKFGDYRHYASLDLLAALFDIPTSKSEMDGSMVGEAFYKQGDLEGIAEYCLRDVEVTARIYLHLTEQSNIEFEVVRVD
jgi:hypothetical protein